MGWDEIVYQYLLNNSQGKKARNRHEDLNRYGNLNWSLEFNFLYKQNASNQPPSPTIFLGNPWEAVQVEIEAKRKELRE